jgi:hypothetical protein
LLTRFGHRILAFGAPLLVSAAFSHMACAQVAQYHAPVVAPNNTLSGVDYNNRWELYGGLAYTHFNAGPSLLQGANLGGGDAQIAYYLNKRWSAVGNLRAYYGTSGATPNPFNIQGPAVSQYMAMAGPQWRWASNQHASVSLHALFGGSYGWFGKDLHDQYGQRVEPGEIGFFNDQISFGSAIGGSFDFNRSAHLALRISPDALLTNYSSGGKGDFKEQFGISVGLLWRFGKPIKPTHANAPAPAVK